VVECESLDFGAAVEFRMGKKRVISEAMAAIDGRLRAVLASEQ
jgi:hypothetical protein